MRLHYLQHVSFEDAAAIADWAVGHGHHLSSTHLYNEQMLPSQDDFDWLIIMGGPMNIYQHDKYPWLPLEKYFIRKSIVSGKTILGVCLGAQLIADVLGNPVSSNKHKEIGWYPISLAEEGRQSPLFADWPDRFDAFHWHGDTFCIPLGSVHVASSAGCWNQAFVYGDRVVGLQFHLEYKTESIEKMLIHCSDELQKGPYIQDTAAIEAGLFKVEQTNGLMYSLLDSLASL